MSCHLRSMFFHLKKPALRPAPRNFGYRVLQPAFRNNAFDFAFHKCSGYGKHCVGMHDRRAGEQPTAEPCQAKPDPRSPQIAHERSMLGRSGHAPNQLDRLPARQMMQEQRAHNDVITARERLVQHVTRKEMARRNLFGPSVPFSFGDCDGAYITAIDFYGDSAPPRFASDGQRVVSAAAGQVEHAQRRRMNRASRVPRSAAREWPRCE